MYWNKKLTSMQWERIEQNKKNGVHALPRGTWLALVLVEVDVVQGFVGLQRLEVDLVAQDAWKRATNHPRPLEPPRTTDATRRANKDFKFDFTSDATESSDKLRALLRLVRDDFQGGTKILVVVRQPLEQRLALDQLQLDSRLQKNM
jgi:hypothetical protein